MLAAKPKIKLNPREEKILVALKQQVSYKEICKAMKMAMRTLEFYLTTIMLKFNCKTTQELKIKIKENACGSP